MALLWALTPVLRADGSMAAPSFSIESMAFITSAGD
eukprot:CAMPEP_0197620602 /NCGR_PEP_ID=MMETSP1338-20131121/1403_1 /TAXON_ID=43686 ORGANISM="Pelagodinium beii, Strain RCC1491" /NCGR_SAMPLE_ID=MMETSP1338 /ASSEMBLY_ACC=CAM_ASM_000754 /LENGTH=35 /DNA_ID= /DNA_START= /DNA_END= /DNA_ORIENTATION=